MSDFVYIGQRIPRVDSRGKVTGQAVFSVDYKVPDMLFGAITSIYVGNGMLLFLNLPLIPLWVRLLKIRYYIFFPFIFLFCIVGAYTRAPAPWMSTL